MPNQIVVVPFRSPNPPQFLVLSLRAPKVSIFLANQTSPRVRTLPGRVLLSDETEDG